MKQASIPPSIESRWSTRWEGKSGRQRASQIWMMTSLTANGPSPCEGHRSVVLEVSRFQRWLFRIFHYEKSTSNIEWDAGGHFWGDVISFSSLSAPVVSVSPFRPLWGETTQMS
jgi:hypothetical protein